MLCSFCKIILYLYGLILNRNGGWNFLLLNELLFWRLIGFPRRKPNASLQLYCIRSFFCFVFFPLDVIMWWNCHRMQCYHTMKHGIWKMGYGYMTIIKKKLITDSHGFVESRSWVKFKGAFHSLCSKRKITVVLFLDRKSVV